MRRRGTVSGTRSDTARTRGGLSAEIVAQLEELQRSIDAQADRIEHFGRRLDGLEQLADDMNGVVTSLSSLPGASSESEAHSGDDYQSMIGRVRAFVTAHVPADAVVLMASAGDDDLLRIQGREVWHFPRSLDGKHLGYHPATSTAAIVNVETMRALGADYIVFPTTALWWLDHYVELAEHLAATGRLIAADADVAHIYSLVTAKDEGRSVADVVTSFRARFERDPAVLNLTASADLAHSLGAAEVFRHDHAGPLPYLDQSIDIVAYTAGDDDAASEAQRLASAAVVCIPSDEGELNGDGVAATWVDGTPDLASVSIIVPCYNGLELTRACLTTLLATTRARTPEILVVDDATTDGTKSFLRQISKEHDNVRVLSHRTNKGYLESVSRGVDSASGEILLFLNNDTVLLAGWLEAVLHTFVAHPRAGVVGGRLVYPDGRLQEAGGVIFRDGSAAKFGCGDVDATRPIYNFVRCVDYKSGALLATPRVLFEKLDGFSASFAPGYYEDVDYCFRVIDNDYEVIYQPEATIVHVEGGTAGTDVSVGMKKHQVLNQDRFVTNWADALTVRPPRPPEPFDFEALLQQLSIRTPTRGAR